MADMVDAVRYIHQCILDNSFMFIFHFHDMIHSIHSFDSARLLQDGNDNRSLIVDLLKIQPDIFPVNNQL